MGILRATAAAVPMIMLCSGCSSLPFDHASCSSFAASIAISSGGDPTPVKAAERTANWMTHLPLHGWQIQTSSSTEAWVHSGNSRVRAIRLTDGTWAVDAGEACGR